MLWEAKDWALPKAGMKERIEQVQCLPFKNFLAEAIAHQEKKHTQTKDNKKIHAPENRPGPPHFQKVCSLI